MPELRASLFRPSAAVLPLLCSAVLSACAGGAAQRAAPVTPVPQQPAPHGAVAGPGYTPHRIYDVAAGEFVDLETLAVRAAGLDVVYFGELHGNTAGHRLQHALLEAIGRRTDVTLSMEMFERDVADLVSGYVAGTVDHGTFLHGARPWPRYFPDYHPLIEEARTRGWPVVAANVPRALASRVAQEGLDALAALSRGERAHAAADLHCPDDAYRTRFVAAMTRHPSADAEADEAAELARQQRYYESQCLKDETMAESIVSALHAGTPRPVLHVTGSFHTDHGDGIPVRVTRRETTLAALSVTLVPVDDLDDLEPAPHLARADYLVFILRR